jgi:hypothetical protein
LTLAPAFVGDLELVADLRGLLARDVEVAFGFEGTSSLTELDFADFISLGLIFLVVWDIASVTL